MRQVSEIEFNWIVFEENIGVLGQQGQGKSWEVKRILDDVPNYSRFIWSPQKTLENYGEYGERISNIEDINEGGFYLWIGDYTPKTFLKICDRIFFHIRNMIFVVDDVHEQCKKQSIPPEFEHLILSKRNDGICGIYISPTPQKVNNTILSSCQHMFSFRFDLQIQIEWMRDNFFGDEAWILLSKDKRKKGCFDTENDLDILPKHSVLYRKNTEQDCQLRLGTE